MTYYKFVKWDVDITPEQAENISKRIKKEAFDTKGIYKIGGWLFDGRDILNKYIVKFHYGGIEEAYASNVKTLREKMYLSRKDKVKLSPF